MSSFLIGRFDIYIINYNSYYNHHLPRKISTKYLKNKNYGNTPYLRHSITSYRNSSANESINTIENISLNDSPSKEILTKDKLKTSHSETYLKNKDISNNNNINNLKKEDEEYKHSNSNSNHSTNSKNSNSSYVPSSDEFLPLDQDSYHNSDDNELLNLSLDVKPSSIPEINEKEVNQYKSKYISPSSHNSTIITPNTVLSPTTNQTITTNSSFISDSSHDSMKLRKESISSIISGNSILNNQSNYIERNIVNNIPKNSEMINQIPQPIEKNPNPENLGNFSIENISNVSRDNVYSLSNINTPSCFPVSPNNNKTRNNFTPTIAPINNHEQHNYNSNYVFNPNIFPSPSNTYQQQSHYETIGNRSPPQIISPSNIPFNKLDFPSSSSFTTPSCVRSSFYNNNDMFSNVYNDNNYIYYISPLFYSSDYMNLEPNTQSYIEHFISIQNDFNNYLISKRLYMLNPVLVDLFSKSQVVDNLQKELFKLNDYVKALKDENIKLHQDIERQNKKD